MIQSQFSLQKNTNITPHTNVFEHSRTVLDISSDCDDRQHKDHVTWLQGCDWLPQHPRQEPITASTVITALLVLNALCMCVLTL